MFLFGVLELFVLDELSFSLMVIPVLKSKGPEKAGGDNKTVLRIMKLELIKQQEASYLYKPGLGPEEKSRSPEEKPNGHG